MRRIDTTVRHRNLGVSTLSAVVCLCLLSPAQASADDQPPRPDDSAAVAAYREAVSTAKGPTLLGPATGSNQPLPRSVSNRLRPRDRLLKQVATSRALGAPEVTDRLTRGAQTPEEPLPSAPGLIEAVFGTFGGTTWRAALLVAFLLAVGVGALASRRESRRPGMQGVGD